MTFRIGEHTFRVKWVLGEPMRAGCAIQRWRDQGLLTQNQFVDLLSDVLTIEETCREAVKQLNKPKREIKEYAGRK